MMHRLIQRGFCEMKAAKTNALRGRAIKLKLVTNTIPAGIVAPYWEIAPV